jgi:hypothetical protein
VNIQILQKRGAPEGLATKKKFHFTELDFAMNAHLKTKVANHVGSLAGEVGNTNHS